MLPLGLRSPLEKAAGQGSELFWNSRVAVRLQNSSFFASRIDYCTRLPYFGGRVGWEENQPTLLNFA
jgi:hypothetical protein